MSYSIVRGTLAELEAGGYEVPQAARELMAMVDSLPDNITAQTQARLALATALQSGDAALVTAAALEVALAQTADWNLAKTTAQGMAPLIEAADFHSAYAFFAGRFNAVAKELGAAINAVDCELTAEDAARLSGKTERAAWAMVPELAARMHAEMNLALRAADLLGHYVDVDSAPAALSFCCDPAGADVAMLQRAWRESRTARRGGMSSTAAVPEFAPSRAGVWKHMFDLGATLKAPTSVDGLRVVSVDAPASAGRAEPQIYSGTRDLTAAEIAFADAHGVATR